jgi:hypothetical protein
MGKGFLWMSLQSVCIAYWLNIPCHFFKHLFRDFDDTAREK